MGPKTEADLAPVPKAKKEAKAGDTTKKSKKEETKGDLLYLSQSDRIGSVYLYNDNIHFDCCCRHMAHCSSMLNVKWLGTIAHGQQQ